MIQDRIAQIENALQSATHLPAGTRAELSDQIAELKTEIAALLATHAADAHSIAGLADVSVREATRGEKEPERADAAVRDLKASVEGFEASHPDLVQVVNRIALTLSNMGI